MQALAPKGLASKSQEVLAMRFFLNASLGEAKPGKVSKLGDFSLFSGKVRIVSRMSLCVP